MNRATRPRLADHAVLIRRGADLQIGVSPQRCLLIADAHPDLPALLTMLDGQHSLALLTQRSAPIISRADWHLLLQTLRQRGLLDEPDPCPVPSVHIVTADQWGVGLAAQFLRLGASQVRLSIVGADPAVTYRAASLAPHHFGRLFVHHHWSAPELAPAMTVLNTGTVETDRAMTAALMRNDAAHLLVRPTADGVVVGPLVAPGCTPCVNCLDLAARHRDPEWPEVLMQLSRVQLPVPEVAAQWATSTVLTEVLGFVGQQRSWLVGRTVTVQAPGWVPRWRRWRSHPGCLCQWDGSHLGVLTGVA